MRRADVAGHQLVQPVSPVDVGHVGQGAAFWLAFFTLFAWCAVATRRHDRRQEIDAYERMVGGGWG